MYQNPNRCRGADGYMFKHNNRWAISFESPLVSPSHGVTERLVADRPWDDVWPVGAIVAR